MRVEQIYRQSLQMALCRESLLYPNFSGGVFSAIRKLAALSHSDRECGNPKEIPCTNASVPPTLQTSSVAIPTKPSRRFPDRWNRRDGA
jgi:hypothetical protein